MSNPLQKTHIIDVNGHATTRNKKVVDNTTSVSRAGSVKPVASTEFGMTGTFKDGTTYSASGEFSVDAEKEGYIDAWGMKTSQVHYSLGVDSSVEFIVPQKYFVDGRDAEPVRRFLPNSVIIERDSKGDTHGYRVYDMKASILLMHVGDRSEDALRGFLAGRYNAETEFHDGRISIRVPFATQYHSGADSISLTTKDSMYEIAGKMFGDFWNDRQRLDEVVAESSIGDPAERKIRVRG